MENSGSTASQGGSNKMAWLVALVVLVGVVVALNNVEKKGGEREVVNEDESLVVAINEGDMEQNVVTVSDADLALPYTEAMVKYDGVRMMFDARCVASPAVATFKDKTKVMLDNRGSYPVRVSVGSQVFDIGAYNFTFVTLSGDKLPATYSVSCGDVANVASITVNK